MRIAEVKAIPLSVPYVQTEPEALWAESWGRQLLVKVCAEDGVCGVGEVFVNTSDHAPYLALVEEAGRHVVGAEDSPNAARRILERKLYPIGRSGIVESVIGGIDVALHDLNAKRQGVPLHRMLGGKLRDRVKAYASLARYKDCRDVEKAVEYSLARGFGAVKLHQHGEDVLDCVAAVRKDLGYGFELMVDLNATLSLRGALRVLPKLERFEISWVEEPIWPPEDYKALGRLSRSVSIPIAAGENEYTIYGFLKLVEEGGVAILQPDLAKAGGITKMAKVAAIAEAEGALLIPHCRPHSLWVNILTTAHFVSTLPYDSMVEVPPTPPRQEPFVEPIAVEGGSIKVPDAPGIGVKDDGWFHLFPPRRGSVVDFQGR